MKILIAGGTGFIGQHLIQTLTGEGHSVVLLTRKSSLPANNNNITVMTWDGKTAGDWSSSVEECEGIINLCGENIGAGRWTNRRKQEIVDSRVFSTKALVEAVSLSKNKPEVFINASGIGYYGNIKKPSVAGEYSAMGNDFLAYTGMLWEDAALKVKNYGTRLVFIRSGVVLSPRGGAFPKILQSFRSPVHFYFGGGHQGFPWIHIEDEIGIIRHALLNSTLSGPVNAVAPELLSMKQFMKELSATFNGKMLLSVPAPVLRMIFGEMSMLFLEGQYAKPEAALRANYRFRHLSFQEALKDLLI